MHRAKTPQSPYLFPACRSPRSTGFRQPWCEKKEEPEEGSGRRWRCGRQGGVGRFRRGRIPARERLLAEGGQSHEWPAAAAAADGPRPGRAKELGAEQSTTGGGDSATASDPRQGGAARKGCRAAQGADLEPPGRNPPAAEKMGAEACADPPGGAGEGRPADEDTQVCSPPICCCWTTFYDGGSDRSAARLWRMARPPVEIMDDLPGGALRGRRRGALEACRGERPVAHEEQRCEGLRKG